MAEGSLSGGERRQRRALWAAIAVLVVAGAAGSAAAVSSGDDREAGALDEVEGVPLLAGAYRAEGELGDGLRIPAGTVLLGDVLPTDHAVVDAGTVGGWRSVLLVVGPLPDVVADLDDQARQASLTLIDTGGSAGCDESDPDRVECSLTWRGGDAVLDAQLRRGTIPVGAAPRGPGRPVSTLELEFGRPGVAPPELDTGHVPGTVVPPEPAPAGPVVTPETTVPGPDGASAPPDVSEPARSGGPPPTTAVAPGPPNLEPLPPTRFPTAPTTGTTIPPAGADTAPTTGTSRPAPPAGSAPTTGTTVPAELPAVPDVPLPGGWGQPTGPGRPLGEGIVAAPPDGLVASLRVPPGAHAVVAPWPTGGNADNYTAVLAVTGDLGAVLDDLSAQIDAEVTDPLHVEDAEVAGSAITRVSGSNAGGDYYDLTATTVRGRAWIVVSTSYD